MHSPDRFFRQPRSGKRGSRSYFSHLSCFYVLTALWASVRLGTPSRSRSPKKLLRQSPLCQVGCATLPEDFTCPLSLDETGQVDWAPEAFTCPVPLDSPGRLDFVFKLPEAFTSPTAFGWPGRLDFSRVSDSFWDSVPGVSDSTHDFHRLCHRPTYLTHKQKENTTRNLDKPQ